jgi:xylulokinase
VSIFSRVVRYQTTNSNIFSVLGSVLNVQSIGFSLLQQPAGRLVSTSRNLGVSTARCFGSSQPLNSKLYLGLDCSTQGLKATAVDKDKNIVYNHQINFEKDLPEFGTTAGYHQRGGGVVNAPTAMFVKALDTVFGAAKEAGFAFDKVAAVSGSGQQHGSVYFNNGAEAKLGSFASNKPLAEQLDGVFSIPDSPIWMDSSTSAQCKALEAKLGGANAVATLTGSRAYERFTGNQIAKIAAEFPTEYGNTERISLISSFMPSILLGKYAPVDYSDGAGMNLMDLQAQAWSTVALEATAPSLGDKLGVVAPSHAALGGISEYMVDRYGFSPDCEVIAWSGDNPCSVAGLGLQLPGDIGLSMGTSDTIFGITDASLSKPSTEGHVFVNPTDPESHMIMLCYSNGSLSREGVCKAVAGSSWDEFAKLVESSPPGNGGQVGFFINSPEITPSIPTAGTRRFDGTGAQVDAFADDAAEARAVLEGQFTSMRYHGAQLGLSAKRIIVTGGASMNPTITKVIADVFQVPVFAAEQPDSASLGAAYRAMHGLACKNQGGYVPYTEVVGDLAASYSLVAEPNPATAPTYDDLLTKFAAAEAKVVAE